MANAPETQNASETRANNKKLPSIDEYIESIRDWANEHQISPHGLATDTGLSPGTLRNMKEADWNPTVSTLREIDAYIKATEEQTKRYQSAEKLLNALKNEGIEISDQTDLQKIVDAIKNITPQ